VGQVINKNPIMVSHLLKASADAKDPYRRGNVTKSKSYKNGAATI
jgi:hypothetical protein